MLFGDREMLTGPDDLQFAPSLKTSQDVTAGLYHQFLHSHRSVLDFIDRDEAGQSVMQRRANRDSVLEQ
jgi:hypothetical protein